jgi:hypothetical protein
VLVFHSNVAVVAWFVAAKTVTPSIVSVHTFVPVPPPDMPTVTTPLTVAPSAGLVMRGLGPGITFETVT